MGNSKGDQYEREFVRILSALDYSVMRSPSSGCQPRPAPDVLGATQGVGIAAEVKYGDPPNNVARDEVDDLLTFAGDYLLAGVIVVRYKGSRIFYLAAPSSLNRTASGNYIVASNPSDLPYSIRIQYSFSDDSDILVEDTTFVGTDDVPLLADWLTALAHDQAGHEISQGIIDAQRRKDVLEGDFDSDDGGEAGDADADPGGDGST